MDGNPGFITRGKPIFIEGWGGLTYWPVWPIIEGQGES